MPDSATPPPPNLLHDSRVFLGLEQPPLVSATQWLIDEYSTPGSRVGTLDLSRFIVVLPTLRGQQRLLQLLVESAERQQILLTPPVITSLGHLPEHLYVAAKQLATDLAQQLAWSKALEQTPLDEIQCLTGRTEVEELQDWRPLATLISKLHTRLANDIWSFSSVAREVKSVKGFLQEESARWDALDQIQKRYYKILYEVDLWDKQAARNYAAAGLMKANEIRCATDKQLILVGTADLNRSISEMLRQIAASDRDQVRVLVAAPKSMADRFDEFGSLITSQWREQRLDLDDSQILYVDQPADQADAAAHYISSLNPSFAADEITIGVPDATIIPQIERSLNAIGVEHRDLGGRALSETGPVRLMAACRDYLESQTFDDFAALVRHPDMFQWLSEESDSNAWLTSLDVYQNNYLPGQLYSNAKHPFGNPQHLSADFDPEDDGSQRRATKLAQSAELLNQLHRLVGELLAPLHGTPPGTPKPIA
ncbi:MAG: ATP-dependent helicase/nuclease subunit B, partial [Mariniblastus sp.]